LISCPSLFHAQHLPFRDKSSSLFCESFFCSLLHMS
jgi:hypothetical protein